MVYTSIWCAVVLSMVALIHQLYKSMFNYWKQRGVYAPPPVFPFGNAKNLIMQKRSLCVEFRKIYEHFKEQSVAFGGYYFLFKPIFVPVDLDIAKKILITDFEHFTDHSIGLQEFDPISKHLFGLKGSQWKVMRAKLTPAFTAAKNRMLFGTVLKSTEDLLEILDQACEDNEKVAVNDLASRFSMDVISSCAFGFECKSLQNANSEIRLNALKFMQPTVRNAVVLLLGWMCPSILDFFKIKIINEDVSKFFRELMRETVTYREANGVTRPDFVHLLLQIRNSAEHLHQPQLTIDEMAAQSVNFFFGGYETSTLTITHCLYELAKNIDIQNRARKEVQDSLLEHSEEGTLTYSVIQNLSYLDQVVQETLRKYPAVAFLSRDCTKDYLIPDTNITIEKGCLVLIPTLGIQRDPDIYPKPDEFDPERFSPQALKNRHPCAWTPFGVGPRTCIAYQFGVMEIKTVIASLLHRYKFTINCETEQPLQLSAKTILLVPKSTVWLNFKKL